jgi:hypothetical protein
VIAIHVFTSGIEAMKSSLSRAIGALALLACLLVPSARAAEPLPEPRPGWEERAAKMEAELKAMQEEAAKDPSRPSMAELQRELDQMAAERASHQGKAARRDWWLTGSFSLNLVLTLALLWALLRRGGTPTSLTQA